MHWITRVCLHVWSESALFPKVYFFRIMIYWLRIQAYFDFKVDLFSSRRPQMIGIFMDLSIARQKCLCVSGKVLLWSKHFNIRKLVPMFYSKLCIGVHKYIYVYIFYYYYYRTVKKLAYLLRKYDPFVQK